MKNSLFLLFLSLVLIACNTGPENLSLVDDFEVVTVGNRYQISIPNYMDATDELHEEAGLQFMNAFKETYIIVIDEDKESFINSFTEIESYDTTMSVIDNYAGVITGSIETSKDLTLGEPKKTTVNGMDARLYLMEGRADGIPEEISYILAYIEGKDRIYAISSWTLKNRMVKYKNTFFQSIKSLKEL